MPSPYLLIPVVIACLYGVTAGVLSAAFTYHIIAQLNGFFISITVQEFYYRHFYELFFFILFAGLAGELKGYVLRENSRLNEMLDDKQKRLTSLNREFNNVVEVNESIQEQLIYQNNNLMTIDIEIRKLFQVEKEDLYESLLILLHRIVQIEAAAMYKVMDDGQYELLSEIGGDFPEALKPGDVALLDHAVESLNLAIVSFEVRENPEHDEPYLMALPIIASGQKKIDSILLVRDIPFLQYGRKMMRQLENICAWAIDIIAMRMGDEGFQYRVKQSKKIYYSDFLWPKLDIAIDSFRENALETTILVIWTECGSFPTIDDFEDVMIRMVRLGDYAVYLPAGRSHLCIFLPLTGQRGASLLLKRCSELFKEEFPRAGKLQGKVVNIGDHETSFHVREELDNTLRKAPNVKKN